MLNTGGGVGDAKPSWASSGTCSSGFSSSPGGGVSKKN